jgi:hypothetical protein
MDPVVVPQVAVLAGGGMVGGLVLLVRGFAGHGRATRIGDTSTSQVASLAIGEVRVSGVVEPAGLTLVSALQSVTCVYYRSTVRESDGDGSREVLDEERAVGFRVRDASGTIRVFPRGAHFDVPVTFDDSTGGLGDAPPGLQRRTGSVFGAAEPDRAAQIAALLTVRPAGDGGADQSEGSWSFGGGLASIGGAGRSRQRSYTEARIEPGQVVTVVGRALPFDQLADPGGADSGGASTKPLAGLDDPVIAADLAAARAAGLLEDTPAEAWGNAAIPGFGIGEPVAQPELDPAARPLPLGDAADADRARRTFEIGPHDLVLAASAEVALLVALGPPEHAVARLDRAFLVGLLGAVMAIGSAVALAVMVGGGFGT